MEADENSLSERWRRCVQDPASPVVWEKLLLHHRKLLVGIAHRVGGRWGGSQREDIDEAIQEMCLKLSLRARSGDIPNDESKLEAHLKTVLANAASDYFRSQNTKGRGRQLQRVPFDEFVHSDALQHLDKEVLIGEVKRILKSEFPPREQMIFILYYQKGYSSAEIARLPVFSLSVKGVESQLRRTVTAIKERLTGGSEGFSSE